MEIQEKYHHLLNRVSQNNSSGMVELVREEPRVFQTDKTPLTELIDFIVRTALEERASDVHFEPGVKDVRIRLRVNGRMKNIFHGMPLELYGNLLSRLKIICGLDIAEKRLPQDGRFSFVDIRDSKRNVDVRVSVVPMISGEKIVLRLLNNQSNFKNLDELDLSEANRSLLTQKCNSGAGAILVAGPVNSGKTTDLYAILSMLNSDSGNNIISIEDPVEYRMDGVNQIQVNEKIGFTFEAALQSVLRQDFDCLAVGEIRSVATAEMLITAALTGRRVFATIHTPGAVKTIFRLLDMGIKPYLLVAAVSAVMAQRLVRRLCPYCKELYNLADRSEEAAFLGEGRDMKHARFYRHSVNGCSYCNFSGYSGRIAVQEILVMEGDVAEGIEKGVTAEELEKIADKSGMVTMKEDGIRKAANGDLEITELMKLFS